MKKPTKKSTIPALALAGVLGYNTIGDKVISEYQNTNQPQAQVEVANEDYKASALEKLTNALAPNKAHAGSNQDYERPDDATLKEWMNQPVEETLAGTDYTKVNDNNYDNEVLEADQPAMVLFYGTDTGSQGLATLTRTLHEKFPEIKVCAYNDGTGDTMTRTEFEKLAEKYPLETAPALLFYKENDDKIEYDDGVQGGIKAFDTLKENFPIFEDYIPNNILN